VIDQLKILHRTAIEDPVSLDEAYTQWKTCLRSIGFHSGDLHSTHEGIEAYEFLLQVICGLKSPMIGETEVLAQFKGFLKRYPNTISHKISSKLIQDSKKIRTKFLKNYGCQTYGSITLKESKSFERIILLGAGALTQDILPIIKDFSGEIFIAARNLDKAKVSFKKYPNVQIESFENLGTHKKALVVIAAPVSSDILEKMINKKFYLSSILDMRSTRDGPNLKLDEQFKYKSLTEIFGEIEQTQENLKSISKEIEIEIKKLSNRWINKAQIRPFGWDDLCY
jgi:glutamyl-tRNA reductase